MQNRIARRRVGDFRRFDLAEGATRRGRSNAKRAELRLDGPVGRLGHLKIRTVRLKTPKKPSVWTAWTAWTAFSLFILKRKGIYASARPVAPGQRVEWSQKGSGLTPPADDGADAMAGRCGINAESRVKKPSKPSEPSMTLPIQILGGGRLAV